MRASLALVALSVPGAAWAAVPPECGPDCGRPGHYLLCNDGLDANPLAGGTVGLDSIDWACAAFTAPPGTFTLEGAVVLFGPTNGVNPTFFEARIYNNTSAQPNPPPPQVMPPQNGALQVSATVQPRFFDMPLTPTYALTGDFRMCFIAGLDDSDMGFVYDADGIQAGRNFLSHGGWSDAAARGVTGDLAIRASVLTADRSPWGPGGVCAGADGGVVPGADAGGAPGADAALGVDAAPGADGGVAPGADAAPGADGGVAPGADAAPAGADASPAGADAALDGDDGGVPPADRDAGGALPAPAVVAISPNQGSNTGEVSVLVTGEHFVSGLSLKIGAIAANEVSVPGPTTISARVPPGIAAGVYDVVVQNPDGQAAILARGYTVIVGAPTVSDGCGCAASEGAGRGGVAWVGLGALGLAAARARRRRARS